MFTFVEIYTVESQYYVNINVGLSLYEVTSLKYRALGSRGSTWAGTVYVTSCFVSSWKIQHRDATCAGMYFSHSLYTQQTSS